MMNSITSKLLIFGLKTSRTKLTTNQEQKVATSIKKRAKDKNTEFTEEKIHMPFTMMSKETLHYSINFVKVRKLDNVKC